MTIKHRKVWNGTSAGLSRRAFVQVGLGATAAGFILKDKAAWAADKSTLGTYPAGVHGSTAFVGLITPLTGPYSSSGKDMQYGFELAVKHLNEGSPMTEAIPSLKGKKGVLGKKLTTGVADSETKPIPAIQAATGFILDNKAIMLSGGVNIAVSIAL